MSREDRRELNREVRRAVAQARAEAARARVQVARVDRAEIARADRRGAARGRATRRARSRSSMAHGADGMDAAAPTAWSAAPGGWRRKPRRLQDRDYRERQIARERARGHKVTHEQLIEAADGMREGAEGHARRRPRDARSRPADARGPRLTLSRPQGKLGRWRAACRAARHFRAGRIKSRIATDPKARVAVDRGRNGALNGKDSVWKRGAPI